MSPPHPDHPAPPPAFIEEVRYSLPQLLKELDAERAAASFAMEKLDQVEIGKLFKSRSLARRVKHKK